MIYKSMKISNFEKWNNDMVEKYNPNNYYTHTNPLIKYIENKRIHSIIKMLKPNNNDKIIEIGCGAGHILKRINKGKITGLDLSTYALKLARKRLSDKNVKLIKGNAEKLQFKDKFDKIICTEVLEHVQHPKKVIKEIQKISKNDSIIVISIPNEKLINFLKRIFIKLKLFKFLFKNIPERMDEEWHLHVFNLKSFKRLIKNKLKIIKIKKIPFFFLPIRFVFKCKLI